MPKQQITSAKLRQPNGHFAQATAIERVREAAS